MKSHLPRLPAAVAVAVALASAPAAAQFPAPPASARGPISVGGYATLTVRATPGDSVAGDVALHEAAGALLLSGTLWQRLSYFGELEAASVSRETFTGREEKRWPALERAYVEVTATDALRLRVGRFLTPVGQWNETHAAPLTWTAARPLTSYRAFAKSTTGAMLAGQVALGSRDAGYALWVSPFAIDPAAEGQESAFLHAAGGRVAVELLPDLYLGFSGVAFRASRHVGGPEPEEPPEGGDDGGGEDGGSEAGDADLLPRPRAPSLQQAAEPGDDGGESDDRVEDPTRRTLLGGDLSWRAGGFELLSEATWLSASGPEPEERGAFVQLAVPVARGLHLTGRAEVYDPVVTGPLRIYSAGLNWHPVPRLTLKLERQVTDRPSNRVADGWLVSLSGLF